ncbi:DEAD/DEAH box helicase [Niallia sp. 01092]|uniref:DEAD/DEAH box helicase n=1 Tax=unclassified Niallia TaxID=2837522 RepID=UPI003FD4BDFE
MSAFEQLSPSMQKKIWSMKWTNLTPIQDQTIPVIMNTNDDVIVSSGTASGKTEAAFLPILSLVEKEAEHHIKVMYISPLKALINNQFNRIEKLCEYCDIAIHRWHGDVDAHKKKKIIKSPSGILQITPESIESLFVNRTNQIKQIFKQISFIVIDEIHSFIDTERGVHLRSLLSRMEQYTETAPRIIGLSATIDNFDLVKKWVNAKNPNNVEIVKAEGNDKGMQYSLMHFPADESGKKTVELFEDMRLLTREYKAIIFCNSRGAVEETTVQLNKLAAREGVGETYLAHHSSIDKKEREYVEKTMSDTRLPKSVVATSSLELGIDIGDIDIVIQEDSTFTVSSLKQRLGRSGRNADSDHMLQLYTTNDDSLLQSLAVMELAKEKWIEPATGYEAAYDVLFQQIISICQEHNGLMYTDILETLEKNHIFMDYDTIEIQKLINHMIEKDYLELIKGSHELIVGIEGERILRSQDFYSVFQTAEEYEVLEGIKKIGKVDKSGFYNIGDNLILAGKLWKIKDIDDERNKIYVTKAVDGKKPVYQGGGRAIHKRIGEKMMEILCSENLFPYANEAANIALADIRKKYQFANITPKQRVIWRDRQSYLFETYTGTIISQTLVWMLRYFGVDVETIDGIGRITFATKKDIASTLMQMKNKEWQRDELITYTFADEEFTSKFSVYLNEELQRKMHMEKRIDIEGVLEFLREFEVVVK